MLLARAAPRLGRGQSHHRPAVARGQDPARCCIGQPRPAPIFARSPFWHSPLQRAASAEGAAITFACGSFTCWSGAAPAAPPHPVPLPLLSPPPSLPPSPPLPSLPLILLSECTCPTLPFPAPRCLPLPNAPINAQQHSVEGRDCPPPPWRAPARPACQPPHPGRPQPRTHPVPPTHTHTHFMSRERRACKH